MPYRATRDTSACPMDKPWAVRALGEDGKPTGSPKGCHPSKAAADRHVRALYTNVEDARALELAEAGTETGLQRDELRRLSESAQRR